jgi:hypothetical protein
VALHGVGVALGLAVLAAGDGRLGHQRPQAGVVGFAGEVLELFVGDAQLLAQRSLAVGVVGESALEAGP